MKRYIDFQHEAWADRTASRMLAARWEACLSGIDPEPPCAGVIDTLPIDRLGALLAEGWVDAPAAPSDLLLRRAVRKTVLSTLADDLDCLSAQEHTLVERMLISDGVTALESVADMEAAYTLRLRLWCDLGILDDRPAARLDAELMQCLPDLLMRAEHVQRRSRIFIFHGMLSGLLYMTGFLDMRMPCQYFLHEVLQAEETPETLRLARNYLEASFDVDDIGGCRLLLHEAVAAPEALVSTLAAQGMSQAPPVSAQQLVGAMNGMLPEELACAEKLARALHGALRPGLAPDTAVEDLRLLAKQGVPPQALSQVMASMLCVLPTARMQSALRDMATATPRWLNPWDGATMQAAGVSAGVLH